jgi:hypothetical protein
LEQSFDETQSLGEIIMAVADKYTTDVLISTDVSIEQAEKKKIVLSNDAYAICQLLETLSNKMGRF